MAVPKPAVGLMWVLLVVGLSVSIWAYAGIILGVAFLGGAIVMSGFWLLREAPEVFNDGNADRRSGVILVMTVIAVAVWLIAAPGFGLFFGVAATFGYLVGLICSKYIGGSSGHNH